MNKIIHYCWFGKTKKNKKILKCLESWKKFFPDWEIMEWNEGNFDINCCDYVKNAYMQKKWAFVADYCRFYALSIYGGLYFDVDVEILKKFPEEMFETSFFGLEAGKTISIALGLVMYVEKDDYFCKRMLDSYKNDVFEKNGFTFKTICERANDFFYPLGFIGKDTFQKLGNYSIYPSEFFSPINNYTRKTKITKNTLSIHYYLGTWLSHRERFSIFLNRVLRKLGLK